MRYVFHRFKFWTSVEARLVGVVVVMGCLFIRRLELLHDCPYLVAVGRREETKAALFHLVVVISPEKERREGASELTCCSPSHLLLVLEAIFFVGVVVGWWSS